MILSALRTRGASLTSRSVFPETAVDHRAGRHPVVGAEHTRVHDGLGGRVEHLVLELTAAELGAHEIPHELEELHALARCRGRPAMVALEVGARGHALEAGLRR